MRYLSVCSGTEGQRKQKNIPDKTAWALPGLSCQGLLDGWATARA